MTRWFNHWKHRRYLDGRYHLLREIGRGASGIVHLALDVKTNTYYAIKELNKSRLERQSQAELLWGPRRTRIPSDEHVQLKKRKLNQQVVVQEVEILKEVPQHENIIKFIQVIHDQDSIFIVTELAEKGVVMDMMPHSVVEPYSDAQCRNIFKQLVNAVDHLHQNNFAHRDIKPQNLLMSSDNTVKLIDFGNATRITTESTPTKTTSTPAFMAPELLKKGHRVDAKCADLWAMGVTLYCLAYGQLPFEKSSLFDLYNDIQNNHVVHSENVDPALCDLIDKLLKKNPQDRISMSDLKKHPWMMQK